MTKKEYILELEKYLYYFPKQERKEAVAFVQEFFDEAYSEEEAMKKLGSPYEYAQNLKKEMKDFIPPEPEPDTDDFDFEDKKYEDSMWKETQADIHPKNKMLLWVLLIVTSPFWLMFVLMGILLVFALFMMLFALFMMVVSLFITGASCVVFVGFKALSLLFSDPLGFVFDLGIVLMGVCISILSYKALAWIMQRLIPSFVYQLKKFWKVSSYKIREYLA